jgi:glycosyltransferase involved in cell wall biosynthesis
MRITIVQGAFLPVPPVMGGAVEKIWFALGKEFARRGHEVTYISRAVPELPREEVIEGVRHLRVRGYDAPASLLRLKGLDLLYSLRARRFLPEAEVLVTHTFWMPLLVRSPRLGKLYVHVARYPKGQMRFYGHAARLQTVSNPIREAIVNEAPQLASKVCCIPNPLSGAIPAQLCPSEKPKRLLYLGRVHPEKGIGLLLDAVGLIPDERFAGWKLFIVGPAESRYGGGGERYLEELKRRAEKISDRIVWTGPSFDPAALDEYYRKASLFIYPSLAEKGETFGLAPLEAMAQGCPALVSNLDCFRDFLVEDGNGFVFDHRAANPAAVLSAKLVELMGNPERLAQASIHAHERALDFSLERVATQYLEDFESLQNFRETPL